MKRIVTLAIFILILPFTTQASADLYSVLSELSQVKDGYEVIRTPTGIDLNSKENFKNSKDKIEPVIHLMIEGPLKYAQIKNLENGVQAMANVVRPEVDESYKNKNELFSGLGVDVVDINGTEVGIINYKMNHEPDTFVKRAIIVNSNGMYTFSIIIHKSAPRDKRGMLLEMLLVASVNSEKL